MLWRNWIPGGLVVNETNPPKAWGSLPTQWIHAKSCLLDIFDTSTFTNKQPSAFKDPFYNVCQMLGAFKKHYKDHYILSWMNSLMKAWAHGSTSTAWILCLYHRNHILVATNIIWLLMVIRESQWCGGASCKRGRTNQLITTISHTSLQTWIEHKDICPVVHDRANSQHQKIVKIYSDLCVAARILALHDVGVYR